MNDEWVCIYSTDREYRAELLKIMLSEHDIECVILNKQDSSYKMFGEVEIHTRRDDAVRAIHLINKHN